MTAIPAPVSHTALQYLQPLREGGSLPAVVETDGGLFVAKFRGAGQGPRALIAELVVGGIALALDMPVPELALLEIPEGFGDDQADPEIRDLLTASRGTNIGLRYLDGAFNYDGRAAGDLVDPTFAAETVWLDAYVTNPDRTARNPNLLIWDRRPWLIDHGSALYAHHAWATVDEARVRTPFPLIADHVLLLAADDLQAADQRLSAVLDADRIARVLDGVPESLLMDPLARGDFETPEEARERYTRYLVERLVAPRTFVREAERARDEKRAAPPRRLGVRR